MSNLKLFLLTCLLCLGLSVLLPETALAQTQSANVEQIKSFIQSIIQIIVSLAGLLAAGFFVVGGISYITSSGNPVALQRAKRTIICAAFGLFIALAAFALTGIISELATKAFGG